MPPRHQIDRLPSDVRQTIKRWLGDENRTVDEFTTFLAELLELLPPTGDDLVDVRLVAGVPQDRVGGGLEHAMQRQ